MTILQFFSAHRALQAELREAAARLILAEDQVRLWRARCESSEIREQRTADSERRALQMVANCESVRSGSPIVPFPDVYVPMPEPVRSEEDEVPEPRKRRASEVVKEMEREFAEAYGASLDRELAQG